MWKYNIDICRHVSIIYWERWSGWLCLRCVYMFIEFPFTIAFKQMRHIYIYISARPCTLAHLIHFVWSQNVSILGLFWGISTPTLWFLYLLHLLTFPLTSLTRHTVSRVCASGPGPTVAKTLHDCQKCSLTPFFLLLNQCTQVLRQMSATSTFIQQFGSKRKKQTYVSLSRPARLRPCFYLPSDSSIYWILKQA